MIQELQCGGCGRPKPASDFLLPCRYCGSEVTGVAELSGAQVRLVQTSKAPDGQPAMALADLGSVLDQTMSTVMAAFEAQLDRLRKRFDLELARCRKSVADLRARVLDMENKG